MPREVSDEEQERTLATCLLYIRFVVFTGQSYPKVTATEAEEKLGFGAELMSDISSEDLSALPEAAEAPAPESAKTPKADAPIVLLFIYSFHRKIHLSML